MAFKDLAPLAPKTFKKIKDQYVELTFAPIYSLEDKKAYKNGPRRKRQNKRKISRRKH